MFKLYSFFFFVPFIVSLPKSFAGIGNEAATLTRFWPHCATQAATRPACWCLPTPTRSCLVAGSGGTRREQEVQNWGTRTNKKEANKNLCTLNNKETNGGRVGTDTQRYTFLPSNYEIVGQFERVTARGNLITPAHIRHLPSQKKNTNNDSRSHCTRSPPEVGGRGMGGGWTPHIFLVHYILLRRTRKIRCDQGMNRLCFSHFRQQKAFGWARPTEKVSWWLVQPSKRCEPAAAAQSDRKAYSFPAGLSGPSFCFVTKKSSPKNTDPVGDFSLRLFLLKSNDNEHHQDTGYTEDRMRQHFKSIHLFIQPFNHFRFCATGTDTLSGVLSGVF